MKNVKIPVYLNGGRAWLKLRPGQRLSWDKYEPHDEGWSYYAESWELSADGTTLYLESYSEGADCDGRMSSGSKYHASAFIADWRPNIHFLQWTPDGYTAPLSPNWTEADAWQRDQFAEAMGY